MSSREDGKDFFRNPRQLDLHTGDYVIVEADRGVDFTTVHMTGELVELKLRRLEEGPPETFPKVIRQASLDDFEEWQSNRGSEGEAIQIDGQSTRVKRLDIFKDIVMVQIEGSGEHVEIALEEIAERAE